MSTPPSQTPKRRVRSEVQMDQKRLADRLGHKERRMEQKKRIGNMESDIADIKSSLQDLTLQLRNLSSITAALAPPAQCPPEVPSTGANWGSSLTKLRVIGSGGEGPGLGFPAGTEWPLRSSPPQLKHQHQAPFQTQLRTSPSLSIPSSIEGGQFDSVRPVLPRPPSSKVLACRCGLEHPDRFDCVDSCQVTTVYRQHTLFPPVPTMGSGLPKNPSIPSMMLHNMDESLATFFITGFLQQFDHKTFEQLLAVYFLGYRYMRWLMQPSKETEADVPKWMLPTESQKQHPHPVVVDYLPWPSLREYLCLSGDTDPRHSISFYLESLVFKWPSDRRLMAQDELGQVTLSKDFESVASNVDNWTMGPPWSDAFPHLMHLVQP